MSIGEELSKLARGQAVLPAQLYLAWLLAQRDDVVPIPGAGSTGRVAENLAAAARCLAPVDLARIDRIAPQGGIGDPRQLN